MLFDIGFLPESTSEKVINQIQCARGLRRTTRMAESHLPFRELHNKYLI